MSIRIWEQRLQTSTLEKFSPCASVQGYRSLFNLFVFVRRKFAPQLYPVGAIERVVLGTARSQSEGIGDNYDPHDMKP